MGTDILSINPYSLNDSELKRVDVALRRLQEFCGYDNDEYNNKLTEIAECSSRRIDIATAFGNGVLYAK